MSEENELDEFVDLVNSITQDKVSELREIIDKIWNDAFHTGEPDSLFTAQSKIREAVHNVFGVEGVKIILTQNKSGLLVEIDVSEDDVDHDETDSLDTIP